MVEKRMDYFAKMYLTWLRNAENIEFALKTFEAEGYDLSDTLGVRAAGYMDRFNLGTVLVGDNRPIMHDIVHVIVDKMDTSTAAEQHVAVGEMILLRGRYDESHIGLGRNIQDGDMFEPPPAYPDGQKIGSEVFRRKETLAGWNKEVTDVSLAELQETKALCIELDRFIQAATNGRILEHFSTFEGLRNDILLSARQLPLCFMGVQAHPSGDPLRTQPIPAPERARLMKIFEENRPHKDPAWVTDDDPRSSWSVDQLKIAAETKMAAVRQILMRPQPAQDPELPAPESPSAE